MDHRHKKDCTATINHFIENLSFETDEKHLLEPFTREFYHNLPLDELSNLPDDVATGIVELTYGQYRIRNNSATPDIHISTPSFLKAHYERSRVSVVVVHEDMPFLVDSVTMALNKMGFTIYHTIHPQLRAIRDKNGTLVNFANEQADDALQESCMYFELSTLPEGTTAADIKAEISRTLHFVRHSVEDWHVMTDKVREVSTHVTTANNGVVPAELQEASDFFDWLLDNNFIFLGYVEYDFLKKDGEEYFSPVSDSALGIFKIEESDLLHRGLASLPPEVRHFVLQNNPIEITKSNRRSIVHRDVLMDYIGVKRFDEHGKVIGEGRFIGLFTSYVYYQETTSIPYIRQKVERVIETAGYDASGHSGKSLKAALEFFPRDELFQISMEELLEITMGIIWLEERPDIRAFFRRDRFERFISCFVFVPRDKYNTFVRREIGKTLEKHLKGKVSTFYTQLTDSALARVNFIIKTTPGHIPEIDTNALNEELRFIINYWVDALREALQDELGEQKGEKLFRQYGEGFPRSYINSTNITDAIVDINNLHHVSDTQKPAFQLFVSPETNAWHLKMYALSEEVALSDILPMLESFGFKVRDVISHRIKESYEEEEEEEERDLLIRDFNLIAEQSTQNNFATIKPLIEDILQRVWLGTMENDGLNALSVNAALNARQVMLLRSYARYAKQAEIGYSEAYIAQALSKHAGITSLIIGLFEARFDPSRIDDRNESVTGLYEDICEALSSVDNLAEDRILRFLADTIQATLRTNFFQVDRNGEAKRYISLKIDSASVPGLPLPHPFREIFVYSLSTEGIHLRGGKIARGGLRWSDRHEDFRTEVLGLMKAQMVKNTVIVPTGSKGGFVSKTAASISERDAKIAAGIESYKQFLSGLLDITDNRKEGKIIPPENTVRYDDDDPYLVVAADKGTATFSDVANGVAAEYGFWLDDAFASGGSVGYDHKAMGITARGAWVSVEKHFLELGKDVSKDEFTVVGVGDMSGDVFGNGMLLSEHIRLVAAFNHLHIFIDPNPDAATSYQERERCFKQARGSWDQYNTSLISKGGGVFERSAKSVELTDEIKALLDTEKDSVTPNELIRLILKSNVDLLWNGGIGTYIKSSTESHDAAGDPSNNTVRVNADELRCKVIGEGGNLGLTQMGRIEFARNGGRLNTDAIDNSAGVDCSDHEVNIKIALREIMRDDNMSMEARNQLLAEMTDEVGTLVLHDNRLQNQALSIEEHLCAKMVELHSQYIRALEEQDLLDRAVEYLPTDKQLTTLRAEGHGLTRPELSVLLSYSKIDLYAELSASQLASDEIFTADFLLYFPEPMREKYRDILLSHPLRREIVATRLTNEIVNHAGIAFVFGVAQDTGHAICNIVRAYVITREIFHLDSLWHDVENISGSVTSDIQIELFTKITQFMERMSIWFLTNNAQPLDMNGILKNYSKSVDIFMKHMDSLVSSSMKNARDTNINTWLEKGVPEDIANKVANLDPLVSACDIAMIDQQTPQTMQVIGELYYELGAHLQLSWLRLFISEFPAESHWDRLAVRNAINEIYEEQRRLTLSVVKDQAADADGSQMVKQWVAENQEDIERFIRLVQEIKSSEQHDLALILVALRQLSSIKVTTH